MFTLVLLRHAKAEPTGPTDFDRPLSDAGRDQARRVADHLIAENLIPDVVLCSSALRARQTWEHLLAGLAGAGSEAQPVELVDQELYQASPEDVLRLVEEHGQGQVVLVIGHEPIMSMTAALIADAGSDEAAVHQVRIGVPTASLAIIEIDDKISGSGRLRAVLRTSS